MYPPNQMQQQQQPQQGSMLFGGGQQDSSISAGRQLIAEAAPIASALTDFARSHPDAADVIDQMLQAFKQYLTGAMSQMPSGGSEGGMPQYG
jgi:hypothetical protein